MDSSTWRSEDIWRSVYIRGKADQPSASRQKAAVDEDNNRNDHIEPYRWAKSDISLYFCKPPINRRRGGNEIRTHQRRWFDSGTALFPDGNSTFGRMSINSMLAFL